MMDDDRRDALLDYWLTVLRTAHSVEEIGLIADTIKVLYQRRQASAGAAAELAELAEYRAVYGPRLTRRGL